MAYGAGSSMPTMPPQPPRCASRENPPNTMPIHSVFTHGGQEAGHSRPGPGQGKPMPVTPPTPPHPAKTLYKAAPPPTSKEAATLRMNARQFSQSLDMFRQFFGCHFIAFFSLQSSDSDHR